MAEPPAAIVPSAQLTSGPAPIGAQLPCDGLSTPWLKPAGQVTVRLAPVAADGPPLATVIV